MTGTVIARSETTNQSFAIIYYVLLLNSVKIEIINSGQFYGLGN